MIAIIDYDAGNIKSVEKALVLLKQEVVVTRKKEIILSADKIILPGVGAFGDAMDNLEKYGLIEVIKEAVKRKIPLLGICLGMQILFERSEETPGKKGLGLLEGEFLRFPENNGLKIPHMGWNSLNLHTNRTLFENLPEEPYVYFVHSYYLKAKDENIVAASAQYGISFHASVQKDQIYGCQFHPEKSGDTGIQILRNFVNL